MNILKYRYITYIFSLFLICVSVVFLILHGLNFSTEFTGGTNIVFNTSDSEKEIWNVFNEILEEEYSLTTDDTDYIVSVSTSYSSDQITEIKNELESSLNNFNILTLESVQPSVGQELIIKTVIAILISVSIIFIFVWFSFKDILSSFSAIIAMLHDTFIIIGIFSMFGYYFGAEIDLLFVTAVLTILSFSLYDTIVIFDKIREINKKIKTSDYKYIVNTAISQTMVRSINNSLTSIIVLFALSLFVQGSLFWFSLALLLGVIFGTYSSPFIASTVFYDLRTTIIPTLKEKLDR